MQQMFVDNKRILNKYVWEFPRTLWSLVTAY